MKQEAMALLAGESDPGRKMNLLREYLQAFALRSLHESGAFGSLSFVGGTALRFLFGLARFSEDLNFSLESPSGFKLEKWMGKLERDLRFAGFDATVSIKGDKVVQAAWVRVGGLLKEARLAALPSQKLSIKIEIDTKPPPGATLETRIINKFFLMGIRHHNLPCLMAGKIRAMLTRKYPKGRDWYDLLWYRTQIPPVDPDLNFLQSSLNQGLLDPKTALQASDWKQLLETKSKAEDWNKLVMDVDPFLEKRSDKDLLQPEYFLNAIKG